MAPDHPLTSSFKLRLQNDLEEISVRNRCGVLPFLMEDRHPAIGYMLRDQRFAAWP